MEKSNVDKHDCKVSVALIVYNHEKYLRQAIESILMQEVNFKYEIVVGEDKSTDNSRALLIEYQEKYPDKFVLILHETNVGGTRNIYDVFMNSKGSYIAILEGDDYWTDNKKLQKQVDFLESNNQYLGVSHIVESRDLDGNFIARHPSSQKVVGKDATTESFLQGDYFSATATMFRNIFLDKSTNYSIYYKAHKFVGDLTFCMLLLDKGRIKILDECMAVYRFRRIKGEENYNSIRDPFEQYNDHLQVLNAINEYFNYRYDFSREYIERTNNVFLYSIKRGELKRFYRLFKTIPNKSKIIYFIWFPFNLFKFIFRRCWLLMQKNR